MNAMDIIREVAAKYDVTVDVLRERGRRKKLVLIRLEIYRRLRDERNLSFTQIGRFFDRDHTTIIHALDRHLSQGFFTVKTAIPLAKQCGQTNCFVVAIV